MKLADATCEPGPGRLAYMLAVPSTVPSESVATTVRPGGSIIHMLRPSASSISGSYAYVSRAATISWKNGQIASQSSGRASLIVTDRRSSDTSATAGQVRAQCACTDAAPFDAAVFCSWRSGVIRTTFHARCIFASVEITIPDGSISHHRRPWYADRGNA